MGFDRFLRLSGADPVRAPQRCVGGPGAASLKAFLAATRSVHSCVRYPYKQGDKQVRVADSPKFAKVIPAS